MNRLAFIPAWPVVKAKLKERYVHLTNDDFAEIERVEDELLERLRRRAGVSSFEIARLIDEALEPQEMGTYLLSQGLIRREEQFAR